LSEQYLSREELISLVREQQLIIEEIKAQIDSTELLQFPWVGNLGHWYWSITTNRVICNKHKILSLGFSEEEIPDEINYQFFTDKLHPDDYEKAMKSMRLHLQGKCDAYEVAYRIQTKNGKWKWFYDRGVVTKRSRNKEPLLVAGIVFDITQQKTLEHQLKTANEAMESLLRIDSLTLLNNRRTILEYLGDEIKKAERLGRELSVILFDIDDFKKINDEYGHIVGDKVLVAVSSEIKSNVREIDHVGRYGGEEFLVVLAECDASEASVIGERVRKSVEALLIDDHIRVTVSGGVKQFSYECALDESRKMESLIDEADKCLYDAKRQGKNQISVHNKK
jgi:diguanylate cyclase (GGDEF)-like protein/PAS domain S-box-containing protein